ncbi:(5-formylfuran-3-yl)methyl phosphate synthase [uncultured Methylibium sp.]|uniref:(5-formylfuran-3-yl)methyl phosphate synthase n=1 Tax=uncultured Methylibium sp. TaxID=381093 RepID=UPI0025EAF551|nr:(5-formylfuran-3-yl)methyl phosphate synthase [uncultured Methylibium sp.]
MKLLVSVRDVDEALAAASAGADFIDLKEPRAGALGALPPATIRAVVAALRRRHPGRPVSATVGDFAPHEVDAVLERVDLTAACGVDYVKVGVAPGAHALLARLALRREAIVPVFITDAGVDAALISAACEGPFPALMLDTADKLQGSLLERLDDAPLRRFVEQVRRHGKLSGLAGALRAADLPRLQALAPDFAGFRSAVCDGARTGALDAARVERLAAALTWPANEAAPA